MEDVHRSGGVMAILGELARADLLHTELPSVHSASLNAALARWDIKRTSSESVKDFYMTAPGGVPPQVAFSQNRRYQDLDLDRGGGAGRGRARADAGGGGRGGRGGN